jgi:hypothetical protein
LWAEFVLAVAGLRHDERAIRRQRGFRRLGQNVHVRVAVGVQGFQCRAIDTRARAQGHRSARQARSRRQRATCGQVAASPGITGTPSDVQTVVDE